MCVECGVFCMGFNLHLVVLWSMVQYEERAPAMMSRVVDFIFFQQQKLKVVVVVVLLLLLCAVRT